MLKIENLSTSYKTIDGDVHVLKDINFEIKDNEIFGIAGESGCGKTTLLNTLYDIVDYPLVIDQGRVVLEGEKDGKKYSFESGKIRDTWWNNIAYEYFSVASGGGTGRTLHPDNVAAGPASYGLTDSLGRVHGDAQFAGSSSVPAHVEMMGLIGMGNNPMVGATVACAVAAAQANA